MKKKILAVAISSIISAAAQADMSDILITEYVEGSSYNKAIELTNNGTTDYQFISTDVLQYYSTAAYDIYNADGANILEGITIKAGETIVLVHGSYTVSDDSSDISQSTLANGGTVILATTSTTHTLNFNGNDSISLIENGTTRDIIGVAGSYWGKDATIRRRLNEDGSLPTQSATYDESEWEAFDKDSYDDLGKATYSDFPIPLTCDVDPQTTISEIQGNGSFSPLITDGFETLDSYSVTGIVTAVTTYPDVGFYLQDLTPDGDELTSDGVFVSAPNATDDMVGNTVCITSTVEELYGLTQLEADEWIIIDDSTSVPTAVDISMIEADNGSFDATLERYEGMLVNLPDDIDANTSGDQDMRVTKTIGYDFNNYRNNIILAYQRPNINPTQIAAAGSDEALAAVAENDDFRLIVESTSKAPDGEIPYYPDFSADPAENYIRINDSVIGMEGVIAYSFGDYRIVVTNELDSDNFEHNTDRRSSPKLSETTTDNLFTIKVGTKNVLNLFNSPYGGDENLHGEDRGAESDAEYQKQLTKIVSALYGLDADIVGLMEIENNGFGSNSTIQELVDTINEEYYDDDPNDKNSSRSISNQYVFVGYDSNNDLILDELDSLGSDVITTGLLYRPSKVTIESMHKISMPEQHAPVVVNDNNVVVKDSGGTPIESGDNYQRETIGSTFKINNTGKTLTVAVNHFKSKGSTCWEEWDGVDFGEEIKWTQDAPDDDLQGSCENFRVAAAVQLGEELEDIGGDRVIVGDLNSYGQEDPLLVLTENPTNKTITTARDTFIGSKPQFSISGAPQNITKTYGYINAVSLKDEEDGETTWSYSYNDEIGALDHILITPSLETRLIDATEWHINAAESALYDYNESYKGDYPESFYVDDEFRSSDHDSAVMSLSYQYGEVGEGEPVYLTISSSSATVPYLLSEGILDGDIAKISLSSSSDMNDVVLPNIILSDDQILAEIELYGIEAGDYTATMTVTRDDAVLSSYTKTMKFTAAKQDSTTAKVAPVEAYDGSGGSFGIFSLLTLISLGFLRRYKIQS